MTPPKGWRWLRKGESLIKGDRFRCPFRLIDGEYPFTSTTRIGLRAWSKRYIRRITKRKSFKQLFKAARKHPAYKEPTVTMPWRVVRTKDGKVKWQERKPTKRKGK